MDVFDSEIAEQGARLQLQAAELNLARRNIVAPIDGIVGIVPVNIGDNVTTSIPIVTLDDRSAILVDFWVPERFSNTVSVGQPVEAMSVAKPGQVFSGEVEAVDNRIDAASRTLRLRSRIDNSSDELRAGMRKRGCTRRWRSPRGHAPCRMMSSCRPPNRLLSELTTPPDRHSAAFLMVYATLRNKKNYF